MTLADFRKEWDAPCEYVMAHTSGSTGAPKPLRLLKRDMEASARATNSFFQLGKNSRYVCPLSLDYIAAKMMCVRAWVSGGEITMIPPSNNFTVPGYADLLAIVPSQVDAILREPELAERVRNVIIGGAPLSDSRRKALIDAGFNAYETYGMTETCSHVALRRIDRTFFETLPGVSFFVDDRGCLAIDIPYMSIGRVVTNDVVSLVDGRRFVWKGRFDNVINSGGIKIYPEEIERSIRQALDPEFEFYIIGESDEKWGTAIVMVAETCPERSGSFLSELRSSDVLSHRLLPKRIIAVSSLSRTVTGKLRRLSPDSL